MPTIHVELFEGRTVEQKRQLARALTDAVVTTLGGSPASVDIIFRDVSRHDWSTAGTLWSDQPAVTTSAPAAQAPAPAASPAGASAQDAPPPTLAD